MKSHTPRESAICERIVPAVRGHRVAELIAWVAEGVDCVWV